MANNRKCSIIVYLWVVIIIIKTYSISIIVILTALSLTCHQHEPLVSLRSLYTEFIQPASWLMSGELIRCQSGLGLVKRRTDYFPTSAPSVCPVVPAVVHCVLRCNRLTIFSPQQSIFSGFCIVIFVLLFHVIYIFIHLVL